MYTAIGAVSQNGANLRVRVRVGREPSYIGVLWSKSIGELAYGVDLPCY